MVMVLVKGNLLTYFSPEWVLFASRTAALRKEAATPRAPHTPGTPAFRDREVAAVPAALLQLADNPATGVGGPRGGGNFIDTKHKH